MKGLEDLIARFSSFAWGLPLLALLVGGGIYFAIRSRFLPLRLLPHAVGILRGHYDDPYASGQISHFQALSTALSSTIGMGNIAGVAVAITIGGPGAVFWMWISGLIGMTTKFYTCTLAILYRGHDSKGEIQGGPMYIITEGLSQRWRPLAIFFCLVGLIGATPIFNVNQLTQAICDIVLKPNDIYNSGLSEWIIGLCLVVITSTVILGGIQRIGTIASRLVPGMVILYFVSVIGILVIHADRVPYYLGLIIRDAFAAEYFDGEAFLGGSLGGLILLGIRRGAFSNEAGIGTAPLAHGAAKTDHPIREGLVAMLGPFIDTIVVCTLTALAILVTDVWQSSSSDGVTLTSEAFAAGFPTLGRYLLMVCIAVFSISSLFSFSYYGTKCLSFLIGADRGHWYNYFYLLTILAGATTSLSMMINLIDGFYALMAIPTMTAAIILAPRVIEELQKYRHNLKPTPPSQKL
ncbi:MAG: amino acid carrier protein [Bacteroidota bacterium]